MDIMKITFIGGGAMGEAILSAILDKRLSTPAAVIVSDINESRLKYLEQKYCVTVTSNNRQAVNNSDIVVMAIKPQSLTEVMADLKSHLKPDQLVLSIIAGARIDTLCQGLDHRSIVRVMPNTPAQIGEGMSVWTATTEVTQTQKSMVSSMLGTTGKEIYVDDEKYLDMVTAISGSGPAYFFLFVESLVDSAVQIGIPRDMAEKLVLQTMLGSAHLLQKSGKPPAELRRMVTSPGGTTAEAILQFENGGFRNLVLQAVTAAYNKAKELGN
ncbi:MAG TPA: pyrroline-5-carboxylate reductase [Dehalococcoidales bacterium]|nr:pyrroline-5-carboxylate reductase [Dehalococcoidales bacterium]